MRIRSGIVGLSIAGVLFGEGGETKLDFSSLPPAVQKTAKQQSEGAMVRGYSKEVEHGKTYYEVELSSGGKDRDVLIDATGSVVEVEQEVEFDALPDAVKAELSQRAAGGKITKVEKVSKGDNVSYEAVVSRDGKKKEITVHP
ncbi:MAG: PepSY-like domain-containing protein [Acidobacteriaceae bacterium]|nr:PepSY-like domain-containing protein [Acidobacteriaceae bacterium]